MSSYHIIQEFGTIYNRNDYPGARDDFNSVYLKQKSFNCLRNFISENLDGDIEVDCAFSVHRKKAKDYIRVKNYVGVIETSDQTVVEILPKIHLENSTDEKKTTREIFLRMLRHLRNSPFKSIDNALLKSTKFPLLEIFIHTFLEELEILIKRGIRKNYINRNKNEKFLKGSLDFTNHINHNLIHKERFFVNHDQFSIDIPHNRLIKSTLIVLEKATRSPRNRIIINDYLAFFEEVKESIHIESDLILVQDLNRLFSHYSRVLSWARVFLKGESFTNFRGTNLNKAILFPMERIFEDYIGYGFKKYCSHLDVVLQDRKMALVDDHNGTKKFRLKPDIVIKKEHNLVLDTKWKILDQDKPSSNYYISQADMYQLYAYGKKYKDNEDGEPYLVLLYPKHESFDRPLSVFNYDENLRLKAVPVDLNTSMEYTIGKVLQELES
jgi:5-methylcytosine-specific restriction enzyme subunit McrC